MEEPKTVKVVYSKSKMKSEQTAIWREIVILQENSRLMDRIYGPFRGVKVSAGGSKHQEAEEQPTIHKPCYWYQTPRVHRSRHIYWLRMTSVPMGPVGASCAMDTPRDSGVPWHTDNACASRVVMTANTKES